MEGEGVSDPEAPQAGGFSERPGAPSATVHATNKTYVASAEGHRLCAVGTGRGKNQTQLAAQLHTRGKLMTAELQAVKGLESCWGTSSQKTTMASTGFLTTSAVIYF